MMVYISIILPCHNLLCQCSFSQKEIWRICHKNTCTKQHDHPFI